MPDYISKILIKLGIENWQMGLVITDDAGIQRYNREWRGKDAPTDVLSFVQSDGEAVPNFPGVPVEAGDIVISLETIRKNALEWKSSYEEELSRALIHGVLHLNGMDHPNDDYTTGMLKLQEELLASAGCLTKETNNGNL
ncbi:MAG: rRNA maturation RNase YbeY [Spirochaetales bacterium]|nr:MAG: rRNA maturation RNase YbeY [Spirochaetales bacterium]